MAERLGGGGGGGWWCGVSGRGGGGSSLLVLEVMMLQVADEVRHVLLAAHELLLPEELPVPVDARHPLPCVPSSRS